MGHPGQAPAPLAQATAARERPTASPYARLRLVTRLLPAPLTVGDEFFRTRGIETLLHVQSKALSTIKQGAYKSILCTQSY